jgi:hypothetical protein
MKKKRKLIGRMVQVVLRVQPEVDEKVREIARKEYRSYSSVLREAISEWLAKRRGKMIQRPYPDGYLLAYSKEHVVYEVRNFFWLSEVLSNPKTRLRGPTQADIKHLNEVLVESFGMHLRILIDFLFCDSPRETDIVAADFLPPGEWQDKRKGITNTPGITDTLRDAKRRADKELAHLTTERIPGSPPEKAWDVTGLADEIKPLIQLLSAKALTSRLSPKVGAAINIKPEKTSGKELVGIGPMPSPGSQEISVVNTTGTLAPTFEEGDLSKGRE